MKTLLFRQEMATNFNLADLLIILCTVWINKMVEQTVEEKTGSEGKALEDMNLDELDELEDEEDERVLQQYR